MTVWQLLLHLSALIAAYVVGVRIGIRRSPDAGAQDAYRKIAQGAREWRPKSFSGDFGRGYAMALDRVIQACEEAGR